MKLTHVSIDHFGPWRDLDLPLDGEFSLFYGPNEAGKSSLLRFVRGVLFGYPRGTHDAGGELRVEHAGRSHTIRREADGSTRGLITVSNVGQGEKAERWVRDALGGVGEDLFETVFAIGLQELQEISSLDGQEVAESIYGLSLGPEGERVLRAETLLHDGRDRLLDGDGRGELAVLLRRREELDTELARLPDQWQRADLLTEQRDDLRRNLSDAERQREQLRHELRGMNFMERVYAPWRKQRALIEERNRLGLDDFPLDAPDRLVDVERELRRLDEQRRQLRGQDQQLKREYERLTEKPELAEQACRVTMLLDEESRIRDLRERLRDVDREEEQARRRKDEQLRGLNVTSFDELDTPRLTSPLTTALNTSNLTRTAPRPAIAPPASATALLAEADAYRKTGRRYKSRVKRFRQAEEKQKRRQGELKNKLRMTGAKSLTEAIDVAEKQLAKVESIRLLSHRERLLELQLKALKKSKSSRGTNVTSFSRSIDDCYDEGLPQLFGTVLGFTAVAGVVVFFSGLYMAARGTWILGLSYTLFSLFMMGVTWVAKQYVYGETSEFMSTTSPASSGSKDAIREVEVQLRKTREELDRLDPLGDSGLLYRGRSVDAKPRLREHVDQHLDTARKLVIDLKSLQGEEEKLRKNRDVLSRMRTTLRGEKQSLHNAKQNWARALRTAGLRETLKVNDALDAWQTLQSEQFEAHLGELTTHFDEQTRQLEQHTQHLQEHASRPPQVVTVENVDFDARRLLIQNELDRFDTHVTDLAIRLSEPTPGADPFPWLRRLKEQVDAIERQKADRVRIRRERKELRSQLENVDRDRDRYQSLRSDIYAEAGVTTKDEFEARQKAVARASQLAAQIDEVRLEVERIAQSERELAIVEDDLMAFDASQNKRAIEATNDELSSLDRQVSTWREQLGRLEAELDELASERATARLRFEREQIQGRLEELAGDYLAAGVAAQTLDGVREQVERNCQPSTLRRAAHYLNKLTQGKYDRIWTQLGRRELLVSDGEHHEWTVDQLSTGTREQLFLAIRLAMAEEFAEQGGELPIVLDDVLVNFDQHRTEAAIDTLIDVAETGQQVLMFSCHLHVASLLEQRGREAVTLPGRNTVRLAG